jgi:RNA polymerase sigma-70 factor (ECF subfamily)
MEYENRKDDLELLRRIGKGDDGAVTELYNSYVDRLYTLIFNQVDKDREGTQEILQETFFAAVRSAGKFRGKSKLYTWLCAIASNKVADYYRQKKRETSRKVSYFYESSGIQDKSKDVITIIESKESSRAIRNILFSMPLHYRQVLLLKYVEKLPVSEICEVMKRSPKSVEGLLTRARREFQAKISEIKIN